MDADIHPISASSIGKALIVCKCGEEFCGRKAGEAGDAPPAGVEIVSQIAISAAYGRVRRVALSDCGNDLGIYGIRSSIERLTRTPS